MINRSSLLYFKTYKINLNKYREKFFPSHSEQAKIYRHDKLNRSRIVTRENLFHDIVNRKLSLNEIVRLWISKLDFITMHMRCNIVSKLFNWKKMGKLFSYIIFIIFIFRVSCHSFFFLLKEEEGRDALIFLKEGDFE